MPISKYSVLKGDPQSGKLSAGGKSPHYLITLNAAGSTFQIAVNIQSTDGSDVLYRLDETFTPPDAAALQSLDAGITALAGLDANPAIDFLRSKVNGQPLVTRDQMQVLPRPGQDASANLNNAVIQYLDNAVQDADGVIYAFGSEYSEGNGIHDIHMNQGNPIGNYSGDNGIWQDGMLIFELPATESWAAIFIAFQTESWTTDDNGNPA